MQTSGKLWKRISVGVYKVEEEDISKVKNRGEDKRQQGMQLRRKGGRLPKIDACFFFSFL